MAISASAIFTSAAMALSRGLRAYAGREQFVAGQSQGRGFQRAGDGRIRLVVAQTERGFELCQQRRARVIQVDELGRELVLLDLGAIDILQRALANFILRACNFVQVAEQTEGLPINANFFVEEMEGVIRPLQVKGRLQNCGLEQKYLA